MGWQTEHAWGPTVLMPATPRKPEVRWWPHCSRCGAQTNGQLFRASSRDEWTATAPTCATDTKGPEHGR